MAVNTLDKKTLCLGILNVTPDSFSDGGKYHHLDEALRHIERLERDGADVIDLGGESSRPGSDEISEDEELHRVLPVLEAARARFDIPFSLDTRRARVAREGIFRGVRIINDISAGRDPEMLELQRLFSGHPLYFLMMHCQGNPKTMQVAPHYPDGVVTEVHRYLEGRVNAFIGAGWKREQLWVDPGIGFGKTPEHCLLLLKHLKDFSTLGGRVAIGTSRKSFIARAIHEPNLSFDLREPGTIASNLWAFTQGARVFRVHDVASFKRAWRLWERIEDARQS